ncbi:lysophospholipid acyltransferase family protein [Lichenihabitans sp. PAMC28606]|uniref:lysophospholipid acyltransferase family protein n=1 Tax=Lichenihabitans sp. PAMC28606 TaxID=2880932 RepID=UPI001D0BE3F5|nr:lysophospholipid acyltransferase family protein [Lichenihabitans sp. PAMC28606]UDL95374.1 lysophospholipid acyltransferase family protein [Lichenihabitans sp. PAMC28606]
MDDLIFSYADPDASAMKRKIIRMVEAATGQRKLKQLYLEHRRYPVASESFFNSAVRRLALDVQFSPAALASIPKTGPLVVVANHPYGVLDGIVISWLIEKVRNDFLVLTNAVLLRAPEVQSFVLPVDFSPTEEALQTNLKSRAAARDHLEKGGCVVIFPAGGVSTAPDRLGRHPAIDAPWQPFTSQLVHRGKATVVPICFMGQNSRIFQIASHLSATLRLSLIFREVKNRIGTSMAVAIGAPIPYADLVGIKDRQTLADALRAKTYALQADASAMAHIAPRRPKILRGFADRLRGLPTQRHKLRRPAWARKLGRVSQPRPR